MGAVVDCPDLWVVARLYAPVDVLQGPRRGLLFPGVWRRPTGTFGGAVHGRDAGVVGRDHESKISREAVVCAARCPVRGGDAHPHEQGTRRNHCGTYLPPEFVSAKNGCTFLKAVPPVVEYLLCPIANFPGKFFKTFSSLKLSPTRPNLFSE